MKSHNQQLQENFDNTGQRNASDEITRDMIRNNNLCYNCHKKGHRAKSSSKKSINYINRLPRETGNGQ